MLFNRLSATTIIPDSTQTSPPTNRPKLQHMPSQHQPPLSPPPSPPSSPPPLHRRHTTPLTPPRIPRPSTSTSALPPLDFSNLCSLAASPALACTPTKILAALSNTLSRLRPNIYLSAAAAAADHTLLANAGITHVLNLSARTSPNHHQNLTYLSLTPRDDEREDLASLFDVTTAFIASAAPGAVLIHCHMGVSRCPAVAAAFLIMTEGLSAPAALAAITKARPVADPNPGFHAALVALAARVRNGVPGTLLTRIEHRAGARVAVGQVAPPALTPDAVWLIINKRRAGITLACGPHASDADCTAGTAIATRIATREHAYETMFPITNNPAFTCPLTVHTRTDWTPALARALADASR